MTYHDEYQKWRQLWIEQRSPLLRDKKLLTMYHAEVPFWMSLELQEYQSRNQEEEGMELIRRVVLLHKTCMTQRRLLQVQEKRMWPQHLDKRSVHTTQSIQHPYSPASLHLLRESQPLEVKERWVSEAAEDS